MLTRPQCPTLFCAALVTWLSTTARAGLDDYVRRPEPAFAWTLEDAQETPAGVAYRLKLTSQVWQGITWQHRLEIYEHAQPKYQDVALLFITGGSNTSQPKPEDAKQGFGLAELCGGRVAVLRQVPNQPLLGGKTEDALIAETFVRYLDTGDENWPLLFPMTKSAVKAMDAVQGWAKQAGKPAIRRFVVAGGSKRGWTTWLTAAVDDRVVAIAPIVMLALNMRAQNPHQLEVWGKYSEQIHDYVERGLMERIETPKGLRLWRMVDPFTYRDRLTLPKVLVNGTNDRYWTLDALNVFWDDLKGPKWVVYVPNSGHGLENNRDFATHAVGALFRSVASRRPLPQLSWKYRTDDQGQVQLAVTATPPPRSAKVWVAHSDTRDFRDAPWAASPMVSAGTNLTAEVLPPDRGNTAVFGDLEYEMDGLGYHLSTQIHEEHARLKP